MVSSYDGVFLQIAGLLQGAAAVVLCQLLGQMKVTNFKAPDDAVFSGRSRAPCIAALHKFNKGWLFPLKDVLVFIGELLSRRSAEAIPVETILIETTLISQAACVAPDAAQLHVWQTKTWRDEAATVLVEPPARYRLCRFRPLPSAQEPLIIMSTMNTHAMVLALWLA